MYLPQITFTRFIAAISIVIYHYGLKAYPFGWTPLRNIFSSADVGVSYFFLLSGFIMAIAYSPSKLASLNYNNYYISRLARIYPIYFISLLPFIIPRIVNTPPVIHSIKFLSHLFLLQAWFHNYALTWNFTGWSLSVEILFYLCFPFILPLLSKLSLKYLVSLTLLIWGANQFIYCILMYRHQDNISHFLYFFLNFNPLLHLGTFIFGMGGGLLFLKHPEVKDKRLPITMVLIASIIIGILLLIPNNISYYKHNGLFAPVFLLFLFGLAWDKSFIKRIFSWKPLIILGEISYGVYILQEPVRMLLNDWLDSSTDVTLTTGGFYLYIIILMVVSGVLYFLVEAPVREVAKKYLYIKTN
jgi:peptidoglycan/LPS O-acetylase OafA/YrhL